MRATFSSTGRRTAGEAASAAGQFVNARHVPLAFVAAVICLIFSPVVSGHGPRALPNGQLPNDARLKPLKDLDGYFPFTPPKSKEEWQSRADFVRRRILVAEGVWPMPTKTPLNAVIHGKISRPDYAVEKVYFESAPGFFVTGNLYRPKNTKGKVPGVLFAHGHWKDARLSQLEDDPLRREIASGQERFERGGRSIFQSMCVQLARMGCVVWQWDMLSDSDSVQFSPDVIHKFAKQRPEMNTSENWGLFGPQAEAHLQSVMGLQTWNSIRSLDFLLSLPEIDPERIAMTGASGGGTQTMILAAIDPRIKLSFPAVMVSTAMQGGCTCENCSLLRVDTGNVEFAGLFAPKPQGMTTANDWTKEMATKGFPELQRMYDLLGSPKNVTLARGEHFPHNYNAVSRSAFYTWLNKHFKLGAAEPVIERDYEPLTRKQLTVWNEAHPSPKERGPDFERKLLRWFTDDAEKQIRKSAESPNELRNLVGPAVEVLIGRTYDTAGDTSWETTSKTDRGKYLEIAGVIQNKTYGEEIPVVWLYPKNWSQDPSPGAEGTGRGQGEGVLDVSSRQVVVWLDNEGKSALYDDDGNLKPHIRQLVDGGATVLGADLLYQGEFLEDKKSIKQTRVVKNPREVPAYTFGYNHSLFAQRTHDILTLIRFIEKKGTGTFSTARAKSVSIAAFGHTGPIAAAARAVSGSAIDAAAIDTAGFRWKNLRDYRDPMFLPGGAKYLDLPGMLALGAPNRLWLIGETNVPDVISKNYREQNQLHLFAGNAQEKQSAAAKWLIR